MAGKVRLFEQVDGLLREVDPAVADSRRAERPYRHMNVIIDLLLTDEEVAEEAKRARQAEEAKEAQLHLDRETAERKAAAKAVAQAKLKKLGLTPEDLQALQSNE